MVIEFRFADDNPDRLHELAAELVRLKVDVLVTHSDLGVLAAKEATSTIPIVMAVGSGATLMSLVQSLGRPGGNLTGSTILTPEISAKRLELLKAAVPRMTRVALLMQQDSNVTRADLVPAQNAAKALNVTLQLFQVRTPAEFESAFAAMAAARIDTIAVYDQPVLIFNGKAIAELAAKYRLPSVGSRDVAEAGCLVGYGVDGIETFRHAAVFVDKILKGAKPSDLPIEQPTKFELSINLKTAKALGLTIPQSLLLRADEVIQ